LPKEVHADEDPAHARRLPPLLSLTCGFLMACLSSSRRRSASIRVSEVCTSTTRASHGARTSWATVATLACWVAPAEARHGVHDTQAKVHRQASKDV
jgi:hypothetical protein